MVLKNVLLVEGNDDEHVVMHLSARHNLGEIAEIKKTGGIDKLVELLPVQLRESDIGSIGVVVDADENLSARWASIRNILEKYKYSNCPVQPEKKGVVLLTPPDTLLPRVGVWLMPNNAEAGALEDFLKSLIPDDDVLLPYADSALEALPRVEFSESHRSKALIHTWLAWQKEPGKPFGQAIKAHYLDADLPLGKEFVAWLKDVFCNRQKGC